MPAIQESEAGSPQVQGQLVRFGEILDTTLSVDLSAADFQECAGVGGAAGKRKVVQGGCLGSV